MSAALRPVVGFEDHYSVTDDGRVLSHKRGSAWLRPKKTPQGYLKVTLCAGGVEHQRLIHRLVAEAWIEGAGQCRTQINHIDGNKKNNASRNLEWCSPSENCLHAHATGLKRQTPASLAHAKAMGLSRRKFTADEVRSIRARVAGGKRQIELAAELGISRGNISQIINRRIYAEVL